MQKSPVQARSLRIVVQHWQRLSHRSNPMNRLACLVVAAVTISAQAAAPVPHRKLPDGVYAVRRDGLTKKEVLPLKGGETLAGHHHRYQQKAEEPPRYVE